MASYFLSMSRKRLCPIMTSSSIGARISGIATIKMNESPTLMRNAMMAASTIMIGARTMMRMIC